MTHPSILVVDDDVGHLQVIQRVFRREKYDVRSAKDGQEALQRLREQPTDLVVTDLMMPGMNGIDLLKAVRTIQPSTEVIVMTAFGSVERAVEAMKEGAYDFIEKPIKRAVLLKSAKQALERKALLAENVELRSELDLIRTEREIVGRSEPIRAILDLIRQVAPTTATVLILGASGTGKELVARAIHSLSPRSRKPFIAVNCAALPESILESEIFGHEKGAFTGAHQRKPGRFELADGGTLFFDEIAELHPDTQAKLLRVLQEGEFERVGGTKPVRVDVRLLAATNKDLEAEVRAGNFREDLYYRLHVIVVDVPPLSERGDDIPLLAEHFLRHFATRYDRPVGAFTRAALDTLCQYEWPGNVRELRNVVERAVVLSSGVALDEPDLPDSVRAGSRASEEESVRELLIRLGTPLDQIKRRVILDTLKMVKGDKRLAAQLLGIATRTIYRVLEDESSS